MHLYAREFGQGAPILILHGLFGFSDNWQSIAKALADHHLVVTPDLRNHGRSPHADSHSYPEMAEDVNAFMEDHWMFSASVVGHSMGGKVAMQLALDHPDKVDKLVVVDISPTQAEDNHSGIFRALLDMHLEAMQTREEADDWLATHIDDTGVRQFLLKNITRRQDGSFTWKMNLPVLWNHYPDILAAVQPHLSGAVYDKPALFIRGARSRYVPDADWPAITALFPQAQLVTIPGAGHWVHAEKPAEILQALLDFLG